MVLLFLGLTVTALLVTALARWFSRRAGDPGRRTTTARWTGVIAGAIVAVVIGKAGDLGTGLLLAAPLFGWCALAGVLGGEMMVSSPRGGARSATLATRRIRDYLPSSLSRNVAIAIGLLAVVLVATTAAGRPDDMGRAGRSLVRRCTPGFFESHGPWPGSFYTGGLAFVVLIGLLMAYLALHTIVRRPRIGSIGDVEADDALRRRAARTVTGAVGVLIAIPLAGIGLTAAGGLLSVSCAPPWWTAGAWALLALVVAALAMAFWCAAVVLTPADRVGQLQ